MKKQISTPLGFLIILLVAGLVTMTTLFFIEGDKKGNFLKTDSKNQEEEIEKVVKSFMEEAYIKKNYEKVSKLYIPPSGFENLLSTEPMSLEGYIEWYVKSVSIDQNGTINVTHVDIVDIKEIDYEKDLFSVSFSFIKEDGEPILYGPCCGEEGAPSPLFFTRVIKTGEIYKIYEDLPYIP